VRGSGVAVGGAKKAAYWSEGVISCGALLGFELELRALLEKGDLGLWLLLRDMSVVLSI
jgi:hypothetical protein